MNKNELISAVADEVGLTKAQTAEAVDATFAAIATALKNGDEVRIIGFGNFSVSERAASEGRNPRTGEAVHVEEKHIPFFKTGKNLRERLNTDMVS